jgi:hypothetical protein
MSHQVDATLVIEFTNEDASSCMSGDWKRVIIVSAVSQDEKLFPVSDPLSYEIDNGRLTIGRNDLCDAYLQLSGDINSEEIRGGYYSLFLLGSKTLGTFTLTRKK